MRRKSNLSGLSGTLSEVLKHYHLDKQTKQAMAASNWAEIVGEKSAAASRPETIRDGILFVSCKSAAWAQELTFLKARIIEEMNKRAGANVIADIRFAGTGLRKAAEASHGEEADQPSPKEIQDIELAKSELSRISETVEGVKDPQLAERMRAAMESGQKWEHWRLAHGWQKCEKCGDVFKGSGKTCERCG
jgi:predicted nucleic acid-binding Zn ribbon protein